MSYTPARFITVDDLLDAILMDMMANHPGLSTEQEACLKHELLNIMADEVGWLRDPRGIACRFENAMTVVRQTRSTT